MNEWMNTSSADRIQLWKDFRTSIPENDQLTAIAQFFSDVPYGSRTMDCYNPRDWPTPWEILYHNNFCQNSISLLIYHTVKLIDTEHKVEMQLIQDSSSCFVVPVIDGKYVLNYVLGEAGLLTDLADEIMHVQTFSDNEIKQLT